MGQTANRDANRALRARFDEVFQRYENLRSGMDTLQQDLADLRVRASSADGLVESTVGARGQLISLRLDDRACERLGPETLAATIVQVTAAAAARAAEEAQRMLGEYLPASSPTLAFLRDQTHG